MLQYGRGGTGPGPATFGGTRTSLKDTQRIAFALGGRLEKSAVDATGLKQPVGDRLAERSPLFGRRTGQRRLEPLRPTETLDFFPSWSVEDRVLAYGVLGGMPAYLRRFQEGRTLQENIAAEILRPEGYLFDEVQFLLRSDVTTPHTYNSILAAVAKGAERIGDIALHVGVDSPTAGKYLHVEWGSASKGAQP